MICIYCGSEMLEYDSGDAYHCPECGANAVKVIDELFWAPGDQL